MTEISRNLLNFFFPKISPILKIYFPKYGKHFLKGYIFRTSSSLTCLKKGKSIFGNPYLCVGSDPMRRKWDIIIQLETLRF